MKSVWKYVRWPPKLRVVDAINVFAAVVMAWATVTMCGVAEDTAEIEKAIGTIARLADQTARQAAASEEGSRSLAAQLAVMQSGQRPWLMPVLEPITDLDFGKDFATLGLHFAFLNGGPVAATQVWFTAEMHAMPRIPGIFTGVVPFNCVVPDHPDTHGYVVLPGRMDTNVGFMAALSNPEIEQAMRGDPNAPVILFITGCIDYVIPGGAHGQTGFWYVIDGKSSDPRIPLIIPKVGTSIRRDIMVLREMPLGSYAK